MRKPLLFALTAHLNGGLSRKTSQRFSVVTNFSSSSVSSASTLIFTTLTIGNSYSILLPVTTILSSAN
jgi:hypothetical protein